jgi:ATP-dependent exoDNAse (exonuclease V) alpha subunit
VNLSFQKRWLHKVNAELRQVRRDHGELSGPDVRFDTKHGSADFAPADQVQFTDTLKAAHIYNGHVGTITGIDARTGVIRARLDATAAEQGREVTWSASEFTGFRHGYAGTIYKGQGRTLDHTYLYHTHHWRSAASYVALTRQRASAQVFVAGETARDAPQTRAANGARGDQSCVRRLGHTGRADASIAGERGPRQADGAGGEPAG